MLNLKFLWWGRFVLILIYLYKNLIYLLNIFYLYFLSLKLLINNNKKIEL